jgi:hypothetical protein
MLPQDHDASKCLMRFTEAIDFHLTKAELNDQMRLKQFDETRRALSDFWSLIRWKRTIILKRDQRIWPKEEITKDLKIISRNLEPKYEALMLAERQQILDRIARVSRSPAIVAQAI